MNTERLKMNLSILLHGHLLNPPWRGRLARRRARGEATAKAVCSYIEKYVPASLDVPGPGEEDEPQKERIFSIWLQGEENAPDIVKACLRSIRANCPQELAVLDSGTLPQWISLPDYIMDKWKAGKIRPAHFADICRVDLLYRYGGIWMDATCFATAPLPQFILDEDFFIYLSGNNLKGLYSFVQNCFFRAKKGNPLLGAWRQAIFNYWKEEDSVADYFVHQLLFKVTVMKNPEAAALFDRMPHLDQDPTHTVWEKHKDAPFDKGLFDSLTADAFFQKTEYKSETARHPAGGSFARAMMQMYL